MEDLERESLDTRNQEVENALENQNQGNKPYKKSYEEVVGTSNYYKEQKDKYKNRITELEGEVNELKNKLSSVEKTEVQPEQKAEGDNETLVNSLRIDNPSLSREDAVELSKTIKKVASINGTSIYEALNDDYVKSQISNKISNQKDIKATAKTSHVASEISNNKKFNAADLF